MSRSIASSLGVFTLTMLLLTACMGPAPAATSETTRIAVFAAASLTDAFAEIGAGFEAANPGVRVTFNLAGSQTLRTQIEAGAAADVFASASTKEMDGLVAVGIVAADAPRTFLTNRLVVILPAANPAGVAQLQDLARPGLKLVLAESGLGWLPYFLTRMDLEWRNLRGKLDYAPQVAPSELFHRQVMATFEEEELGAQFIPLLGADSCMWASDYPHTDSTFPKSRHAIEEALGTLSTADRRKITATNCARLYGFEHES